MGQGYWTTVLGTVAQYTASGDIAMSLMPCLKGVVAISGPHPEADLSFCE